MPVQVTAGSRNNVEGKRTFSWQDVTAAVRKAFVMIHSANDRQTESSVSQSRPSSSGLVRTVAYEMISPVKLERVEIITLDGLPLKLRFAQGYSSATSGGTDRDLQQTYHDEEQQ